MGAGAAARAERRAVQGLVRALLTGSEDREFLLERVLPTLIPAVVQLLQAAERAEAARRSADENESLELKPVNLLATYLYRANPQFGQPSAAVREHRELINLVIAQEKRRLEQDRFVASLERDVRGTVTELGVWPTAVDSNQPQSILKRGGPLFGAVLDELEFATGLAGLQDELLVALEVLDVNKSGATSFREFCSVLAEWLRERQQERPELRRSRMSSQFRKWIESETNAKVRQTIEAYFRVRGTSALFETLSAPDQEGLDWNAALRFMREVMDHALGWDVAQQDAARFDLEMVLDELGMAGDGSAEMQVISAESFAGFFGDFVDHLTLARLSVFV